MNLQLPQQCGYCPANPACFSGLIGLAQASDDIIGTAFDILALEALFLVPRCVSEAEACGVERC
jgi:hypothetical protein